MAPRARCVGGAAASAVIVATAGTQTVLATRILNSSVLLVILFVMRTAIFVPDAKAERFDRIANRLSVNRSEFFVRAADRFSDEVEGANELTMVANAVLAEVGQPSDFAPEIASATPDRILSGTDW